MKDEHESILALRESDGDVVTGVGANATFGGSVNRHDMNIVSRDAWVHHDGGTRHVPKVVQDEHFRTYGVVLVKVGGGVA